MAYAPSQQDDDIHLDGFVTRHMAEFTIEDARGLSALIEWLSVRQARIHHLVARPAGDAGHHVKLIVERISGPVFIGHLDQSPCIGCPRVEHLFVNEQAPTRIGTARA